MARKKIGLALGSGGVRGMAHVGIIKQLVKNNIPIDYIAGSSIGAWVGAHFALFQDVEKLELYTLGKKREKMRALFETAFLKGGLIGGAKIEKLLGTWFENKTFKDCRIPFCAVATNLKTGASVNFKKGNIAKAVRASMSVPTFFSPTEYDDMLLVDGGVSNPVPDDIVRKMGADVVISVNLDNFLKNSQFRSNGLIANATRSLDITRYYLSKNSMKDSDIILEPYTPVVGFLGFSEYFRKTDCEKRIMQNGERELKRHLAEIKDLID